MAKFTGKNIEFKNNQKAIFGDNDESSIFWNNINTELTISTVVSGIDPTAGGHLVTKRYVDNITMSSGIGVNSFIALTDTPSSYSDKAGYIVTVNQESNALEFTPPGIYNMDGGFASSVYGGILAIEGGHA